MVTQDEAENFQMKFRWMNNWMCSTMHKQVTVMEILAAIMVMEKEDPTAIVKLMREVNAYQTETREQ